MNLPVTPPVKPMLAKLSRDLPEGDGLLYEPKWDGFRCIVFREGDNVELGSRNERPMNRYFPELVTSLQANLPERCVLDGEMVIATERGLDFDALQMRIHPAASRVKKLAAEMPSSFVAFDLLALNDADLREVPFAERRAQLEAIGKAFEPPVYVTPLTTDVAVAEDWFNRFEGAGLDGVVVKRKDQPYCEDQRVMIKVKHQRTCDCVVAGFRWHKSGGVIGSLLLGLYDGAGSLHHVGVAGAFTIARRKELVEELAPYRDDALEGHPWAGWADAITASGGAMPGGLSRWSQGKDLSWEPLRPELVCEVAYEHMQGDRFRHAAHFQRWRHDRDPPSCTYDQLEVVVPAELADVFGA
ncbi:MAG: ATP-dependent DNA ligase [Acidimicrobiia bacterium]|nr:ATP-dependent DNA ligase [Acidimicrobiia bacterium]